MTPTNSPSLRGLLHQLGDRLVDLMIRMLARRSE